MPRLTTALAAALFFAAAGARAADPNNTIAQSEQVLNELLAIPGRQLPARLLNEAQGVAIIPRVIKIGFVAGVRRGHGVMLARDNDGQWSLPRFIRLTGGSVGWQAGIQGTDVVLVFRTRGSIERLMRGRFTIGVDAAAAAGPVGRNAAAATDASLSTEIFSYSRSRGLFLGASVDGSVIEIDRQANAAFYQSNDIDSPQVIPLAATRLQTTIAALTGGQPVIAAVAAATPAANAAPAVQNATAVAPAGGPAAATGSVVPAFEVAAVRTDVLRRTLVADSAALAQLLSPEWQTFLALPAGLQAPDARPNAAALADLLARFDQVAADAKFADLNARPEFQSVRELLREYVSAVQAGVATLQLPPPPPMTGTRR
jgi:lipid-binding SYLF domain-containing protein